MPEWKDRLLEFAYTLYLEGLCDCGRPKFECRHPSNVGLYEVADVTCHAQAAVEAHTGQKGFKPEPGQRFYATEIDPDLVTRRTFAPLLDEPGDEQDDADQPRYLQWAGYEGPVIQREQQRGAKPQHKTDPNEFVSAPLAFPQFRHARDSTAVAHS